MSNSVLQDAQAIVLTYATNISNKLSQYVVNYSVLSNLPAFFLKAYQNPILTTAVYSTDENGDPFTYAGTGGYGCYGPPAQPLPLPLPAEYPCPLNDMWVRDACAQYHSYLGIFLSSTPLDPTLRPLGQVIEGVVRACATFLTQNTGLGVCATRPKPSPAAPPDAPNHIVLHAFAPKGATTDDGCDYEPDSLAYLIFLAADYEAASGSSAHLDATFWNAMQAAINTLGWTISTQNPNAFLQVFSDGSALTMTPYRPSDDPSLCWFNIPVNAFIASMMKRLSTLAEKYNQLIIKNGAYKLYAQIKAGIMNHGLITLSNMPGPIFLYETNGGLPQKTPNIDSVAMDDANIPSLLALEYLGFCDDSFTAQIYATTRNSFIFSKNNPYFYASELCAPFHFEGVGSAHTCNNNGGGPDSIWPLAIMMRGLTADIALDPIKERFDALAMLVTAAGLPPYCDTTYNCIDNDNFNILYPPIDYQHESFQATHPTHFTRGWFAWANALFGEWVDLLVRGNLLPEPATERK